MAEPSKSTDLDRIDGMATPVLVSACLLGRKCRYDGQSKQDAHLEQELLDRGHRPVPFCPEERGGLTTPRPKAWIGSHSAEEVWSGEAQVVTEHGADVTPEFQRGAQLALEQCNEHSISIAYLKERSPSCGVATTHVNGELVEGPGVTAAWLAKHGIRTCGR